MFRNYNVNRPTLREFELKKIGTKDNDNLVDNFSKEDIRGVV